MNSIRRPTTLAEVAALLQQGASMMALKDFYHEFWDHPTIEKLEKTPDLKGHPEELFLTPYFQAVAEHFARHVNRPAPTWTRPMKRVSKPWFASPGNAMRNYLLISSPAPFRERDIFIAEETLEAV